MEPVALDAAPDRTVSLEIGRQLDLRLQTIGPGEYAAPPELRGSSLRFVEMSYVSPPVPGGPTQRFRFEAVARGRTVIVFRHTGQALWVSDTVEVS